MPAPAYDALLILHVAAAFIGFGSVATAGLFASAGRRSANPAGDERLVRFFRPGLDWPARLIFLVPVLGLTLLFGGDHPDIPRLWPWLGLFLWLVAAGVTSGRQWPAEKRAQRELVAVLDGDETRAEEFSAACRQMEQAASVTSVLFVAVVMLMILQP